MTKILLTRHGHVEGIDPVRFRGRSEIPLTALGEAQAAAVARRIAGTWRPKVVYTSPMGRALTTARRIASACQIDAEILEGLNDLDYGAWQWKTYAEVESAWPLPFNEWLSTPHLVRFPGGESLQDLVARGADVLRSVIERHGSDADVIVLVAHDSVNRALLLQLLDQPLSAYWRLAQHPCCLNEIDITKGKVGILRVNETQHLEGIG
jgi:phosphoserine phosphatase